MVEDVIGGKMKLIDVGIFKELRRETRVSGRE
jgi:hypothetical protein